jgi:hypothetical protein
MFGRPFASAAYDTHQRSREQLSVLNQSIYLIRAILLALCVRDAVSRGQFWGELSDWALRTFGSGAQFVFPAPFLQDLVSGLD